MAVKLQLLYLSVAEVRLCVVMVQRELQWQQVKEAGTCSCHLAESVSDPHMSCAQSAGVPLAGSQALQPPVSLSVQEQDWSKQQAVMEEPYEKAMWNLPYISMSYTQHHIETGQAVTP